MRATTIIREFRFLFRVFLGTGLLFGIPLYVFPASTESYWAWTVSSPLSSTLIGSGFLGLGAYSGLVLKRNDWAQTQNGIGGAVMFFAVLLVATIVDRQMFSAYRIATSLWVIVCCTGAFVMPVLYRKQRRTTADQNHDGDQSKDLSRPIRAILAIRGFIYLSLAILWLVQADVLVIAWPWKINPLELRILTAQLGIIGWNAIIVLSGRSSWEQMRTGIMLGGVVGLLQLLGLLIHTSSYIYSGLGIFLPLMFLEWLFAALLLCVLYEWRRFPKSMST